MMRGSDGRIGEGRRRLPTAATSMIFVLLFATLVVAFVFAAYGAGRLLLRAGVSARAARQLGEVWEKLVWGDYPGSGIVGAPLGIAVVVLPLAGAVWLAIVVFLFLLTS